MNIIIKSILAVTMNSKNEIMKCNIIIENGKIKKITTSDIKNPHGFKIINGDGLICIPALINGHVHSDVTLARGLGDGLTLYQQDYESHVSRKKWFREELSGDAALISRLLLLCEAIKCGIGFICDVPFWSYNNDLLIPLQKSGVKGAIAIDYRTDFLNGHLLSEDELGEKLELIRSGGFIPIISGPSEEHYEALLLKKLQKIAEKHESFIHLHLAETEWRVKMIKEKYGLTSVEFLEKIGVLNNKLIASHCVHLTETDINLLNKRGVGVINCPTAEMKISDGIAPVVELLDKSHPVGLGTDGALWNDSSDMFAEMKNLLLAQRVRYGADKIMPLDVISASTIWGARIFNIEDKTGGIEEGKNGSIAVLNPNKPHSLPLYHGKTSNVLQVITTCMNAQDVETLIVNGNILMENRKLLNIDEKEILEKSRKLGYERFSNLEL